MNRKKLRIKVRRKLDRSEIKPKQVERELHSINLQLWNAFPDPIKRKEYLEKLIEGLDKEIEKGEQNGRGE